MRKRIKFEGHQNQHHKITPLPVLCVLCDSVVGLQSAQIFRPQRHREHEGFTEKVRLRWEIYLQDSIEFRAIRVSLTTP
jgi:hypothetical protein